ncbi:MAG: cytochrome c, partial [Saprospiraceae bacterium]
WTQGDQKPINYDLASVMPAPSRFVKTELDNYFNEPIELEILPDGRLVFIERRGAIKLYDPALKSTKKIADIEVYSGQEDGLIGMALDPNYAQNKYAFFCISDPDAIGQKISRFTFDPDAEEVLSDEVVVIRVGTQRDECCHSGGSIEFDHEGNLWAGFGDNTNPHKSNGFSPSDEMPGRKPWDAQRTASNTQDLRGKIIKIKVNEDGSYSIPNGNLFPKDGSQGRPEIYVMGCRNPYRFSVDSETGYLYWGEVGPDARDDQEDRGPRGHDEINQAKKPGFFGWPYFVGNNKAYNDYDFATKVSNAPQDSNNPINTSRNNTGSKNLPAAQPAMIYYPYAVSDEFPELSSGGRNAMAGPVYHSDQYTSSSNRFPDYYDDKLFAYDWMRGWIMAVSFDKNGDMSHMERFAPQIRWNNLIDIAMGPEGDFYTLEYGTGWFTANENATLSHLTYNPGNRAPEAHIMADNTADMLPLKVSFEGNGSTDLDGENLKYEWDFGDGNTASGADVNHTYTTPGIFNAVLKVSDIQGDESSSSVKILAGNAPPELTIKIEGNSDFYFPNKPLKYSVTATDKEDGVIASEAIAVSVDYLAQGFDLTSIAQGHQALSELKAEHLGVELISNSDCVSCHKVDGKSTGPSYTSVASKYAKDRKSITIQYLVDKIIAGGGGAWGETAMAAHPDFDPKDAATIAKYILSINEPKKEVIELPAEGSYTFSVPENQTTGGSYLMMASYTDKGAKDIEPLRSFKNIVLRNPMMSSTEFSFADKASKFTVTKDMAPDIEDEVDIVIVSDDAELRYDNIDLTDISSIVLMANAVSGFMSGGSFEIYLDDTNSSPIQKVEIPLGKGLSDMKPFIVPLKGISGKHNIIIKGKSNTEGTPICAFFSLIFNTT